MRLRIGREKQHCMNRHDREFKLRLGRDETMLEVRDRCLGRGRQSNFSALAEPHTNVHENRHYLSVVFDE
jgi:hypothetical protein